MVENQIKDDLLDALMTMMTAATCYFFSLSLICDTGQVGCAFGFGVWSWALTCTQNKDYLTAFLEAKYGFKLFFYFVVCIFHFHDNHQSERYERNTAHSGRTLAPEAIEFNSPNRASSET